MKDQSNLFALKISGEYACLVSNEVGSSSCRLEVTEKMLRAGLSDEDIIIIIISVIAAAIILTLLLLIITIYCICRRTKICGGSIPFIVFEFPEKIIKF